MTETKQGDLGPFLDAWQQAIDAGEWDTAVLTGISGYLYFHGLGLDRAKQGAVGLVIAAIEIRERKEEQRKPHTDQTRCSFCGKDESQVRLGAGPHAFICNECVDLFAEHFHKPKE
jgi:ribosomal protein L37AE/L43A